MKHYAKQLVAGLVAAIGLPNIAPAHDYTGGLLGSSPSATDLHVIQCGNDGSGDAQHLYFELHAGPPGTAPLVSAQVQVQNQRIAESITDPVNGDISPSRGIEIPGGNANYYVTVDKSGPGKASYSFTYHCQTANGDHTGTNLITLQDQ